MSRDPSGPKMLDSAVDYWQQRAKELGARAVISTDHVGSVDGVTSQHRQVLLPQFAAQLPPVDANRPRVVLDLGCGTGRLTPDLAAIAGRAIGVEPVQELLQLAEPTAGVEYRLLTSVDGPLPLADGEVDAAFTCLVLGGVAGAGALAALGGELHRVLRPGGVVFLAESVSDQPAIGHWTFRSVDDYRDAMPWAQLRQVAQFDDAGDAVSVMVGRRPTG
ncbi:MAG: class I SAM-dependent methyltransferase [Solirubrobacteraceae bacterium]|nr:class I SAM-dependent methyltransferase [Solirubrobacteraceae bacterium]